MVNDKKYYMALAEKYLAHQASRQECDELLEWMQGDADLHRLQDTALEQAGNDMPENRRRHIYARIMDKARESQAAGPRRRPVALRLLAAACAVLAVACGTLLYRQAARPGATALELRTEATDRSQALLPDGTEVHLNALSTLTCRMDGSRRTVHLDGEGYFEVAPDRQRPFTIVTSGMELLCLGTKFDIKNYEDDSSARVILREGSVKVSSGQQEIVMTPGTCVTYNKSTGRLSKASVQKESATDWMHGCTYYRNESLENIANELSRSYGKRIVISTPEIARTSFSGYLGKASLNDVLNALSTASGLKYEYINDSTIHLYSRTGGTGRHPAKGQAR